jgi:hypothetical protein
MPFCEAFSNRLSFKNFANLLFLQTPTPEVGVGLAVNILMLVSGFTTSSVSLLSVIPSTPLELTNFLS